jgi:hypothetical protein
MEQRQSSHIIQAEGEIMTPQLLEDIYIFFDTNTVGKGSLLCQIFY